MHVRSTQELEIYQSWPAVAESNKKEAFNSPFSLGAGRCLKTYIVPST